jgi:hypothetical protein
MKISHLVALVNSLCRCENMGIASLGEQAAAAPGVSLFELSEICHDLVTLRETQVLYARLRCSARAFWVLGAGPGLLRRWRTWVPMSTA